MRLILILTCLLAFQSAAASEFDGAFQLANKGKHSRHSDPAPNLCPGPWRQRWSMGLEINGSAVDQQRS